MPGVIIVVVRNGITIYPSRPPNSPKLHCGDPPAPKPTHAPLAGPQPAQPTCSSLPSTALSRTLLLILSSSFSSVSNSTCASLSATCGAG